MAGLNKVLLMGNLGKDPEVRTFEGGNKVTTLALATNRFYKAKDGSPVEETEWHNVVLWGNLAELAEKYLTKGRQVFIEGRIRTRQYDDKEGVKRYITEVVAENMTFVGSRPEGQGPGAKTMSEPPATGDVPTVEDDLPF